MVMRRQGSSIRRFGSTAPIILSGPAHEKCVRPNLAHNCYILLNKYICIEIYRWASFFLLLSNFNWISDTEKKNMAEFSAFFWCGICLSYYYYTSYYFFFSYFFRYCWKLQQIEMTIMTINQNFRCTVLFFFFSSLILNFLNESLTSTIKKEKLINLKKT